MLNLNFTIYGNPITKKNSSRIIRIKTRSGKTYSKVMPSKQFERYQKECAAYMPCVPEPINKPVNLKCVYYMQTRRKVDLLNLLNATADILVHYSVLEDDNCKIIVSVDGSVVSYNKENPRVEIEIKEIE